MYYFVRVPELPQAVAHQDNSVSVIEYLVTEGDAVSSGAPLICVENWWAEMEIDATTPGVVRKIFFDGTRALVKIGDPFAIIVCDGEDAPAEGPTSALRAEFPQPALWPLSSFRCFYF